MRKRRKNKESWEAAFVNLIEIKRRSPTNPTRIPLDALFKKGRFLKRGKAKVSLGGKRDL